MRLVPLQGDSRICPPLLKISKKVTSLPAGLTRYPSRQPGPVIRQQLRPSICLWPNTEHSLQPAATQECSPVPASSCSARNVSSRFTQSASTHPSKPSSRVTSCRKPSQTTPPTFPAAPYLSRLLRLISSLSRSWLPPPGFQGASSLAAGPCTEKHPHRLGACWMSKQQPCTVPV